MSINIINTESFTELRQNNGYYIDKTGFLERFLPDPYAPYRYLATSDFTMITCPRRFGKTLFMSMLAEFFDITKDSRQLFAGLKITNDRRRCKEWMNKYPVISLSFKNMCKPTFKESLSQFQVNICNVCEQHKYLLSSERVTDKIKDKIQPYFTKNANLEQLIASIYFLSKALSEHYNKRVIVLIDDFDAPVASAAENGYYDDMMDFLMRLNAHTSRTHSALDFAILTCCLRVWEWTFFTGYSNTRYDDVTLSAYQNVFGFTQDEVDKLLQATGFEDRRETIMDWYGGYRFGNRNELYCPWSVMQYLTALQKNPQEEPEAYLVNTSSNDLPGNFILTPEMKDVGGKVACLLGGLPIKAYINPSLRHDAKFSYDNNFWTYFFMSGYLTQAKNERLYPGIWAQWETVIDIPNREVRAVFQKEFEAWLAGIYPENEREALYNALWKQDIQKVEEQLTALLVKCGFQDVKEAYLYGMMFGVLAMRYGDTVSNAKLARGLYGIVVEDKENSRAAVLEFKLASSAEELEACVDNALQKIAEQDYDAPLRANGWKNILHAGIALCDNTVKVGFEQVSV